MKASPHFHRLEFKLPAGTSRGILRHKDCWFLKLEKDGMIGIGECSVIPGLSPDIDNGIYDRIEELVNSYRHNQLTSDELEKFPALRFAIEMAEWDLANGGTRNYIPHTGSINNTIPINGLIWMGELDFMRTQIQAKLKEGFNCLKLKIAALDFQDELNLIKWIRTEFQESDLTLRLDANGGFSSDSALEKLNRLSAYDIHSIEQPIKAGQLEEMKKLCAQTPIPIALDEELISVQQQNINDLLSEVEPQYIILKPSLLGGIERSALWISEAENMGIGWWVTSALESNVGLSAIAQWVRTLQVDMPQGLGTGALFTNNISAPLRIRNGTLEFTDEPWGKIPLVHAF